MSTQGDYLTEIADAIRAKEGSSDPIPANTFAQRISKITTGYDTSDATAAAAQILAPYTAYGASGKITGTIPTQQGKTITPGTSNQTAISAGNYAAGNIVVEGDADLIPGNIKSGVSIFDVAGTLQASSLKMLTQELTNLSRFSWPVNLSGKAFWLVPAYPITDTLPLSTFLPMCVALVGTKDGKYYECIVRDDPYGNEGVVETTHQQSSPQITVNGNQTNFVLRTGLGFAGWHTLFYEDD